MSKKRNKSRPLGTPPSRRRERRQVVQAWDAGHPPLRLEAEDRILPTVVSVGRCLVHLRRALGHGSEAIRRDLIVAAEQAFIDKPASEYMRRAPQMAVEGDDR